MRPEPGASETGARLRAMGREPLVVPLLATVPTGAPMPAGPHDAVVLTSATAARLIGAEHRAIRALPVHAIGERTARAAREAGFARVIVGAGGEAAPDGAALGRALAPLHRGRTLLYPCAEDRRPGLEASSGEGGARVAAWPLYRAIAIPGAAERLTDALEGARPAAVLLHSPSAARALGTLGSHALEGVPLACLSAAVADAVPREIGGERRVAARPEEAALLALLDREGR